MGIISQFFQYAKDKILERNKEEHIKLVEEAIKDLKERGYDINLHDENTNLTLLHFVVCGVSDKRLLDYFTAYDIKKCSDRLLPKAAQGGSLDIMEWLLDNGVDVNERDTEKGQAALHKAVFRGDIDMVNFLLSKNADVNIRTFDQESPLNILFFNARDDESEFPPDETTLIIAKTLINRGASVYSTAQYPLRENIIDNVSLFSQVINFPFLNEKIQFQAIFLLISKLDHGVANFRIEENVIDFLIEEYNIDQIFAYEEDTSFKITVACNLSKIFSQINHDNKNQKVKEIQDYISNKRSVLIRWSIKTQDDMDIDVDSQLNSVLKELTIGFKIDKKRKVEILDESINDIAYDGYVQKPDDELPVSKNHNVDLLGSMQHNDV